MIKFLYFDDEPRDQVKPYIDAVVRNHNDGEELVIEHKSPITWDKQIQLLRKGGYQGVILDLRLDQKAQWEGDNQGKVVHFRAEELAQKMRIDASENDQNAPDVPIILWSTEPNLNNSGFSRDSTPKDLFDLKVVKTRITKNSKIIRRKLISLAKGYEAISDYYSGDKVELIACLNLSENAQLSSDPRIFNYFGLGFKPPVHDVARFILDELIRKPSLLINEQLLATRLGVSIEKSPRWGKFVDNILYRIKYSGVFSSGWNLYVNEDLLEWWHLQFEEAKTLRYLSAAERVRMLNEKIPEYNLAPIDDKPESKYWDNCVIKATPVTQKSSFIVNIPHRMPWQDNSYISMEAINERLDQTEGITIDELDRGRLEAFKNPKK